MDCENDSIAFYSTSKLVSVETESRNPDSGDWDPVDRLDLTHEWIYQRTDFEWAYDPVLWLDTVQQIGCGRRAAGELPPLDFDAVMLAGKMDYDTLSDWTDLLSWRMVPRIAGIANGIGGRIEVTYGQAEPCGGGRGRDGANYLADKTGDCYNVDMGSDPEQGYETWSAVLQTARHQGRRTRHGGRLAGHGAPVRVPGHPPLDEPGAVHRTRPSAGEVRMARLRPGAHRRRRRHRPGRRTRSPPAPSWAAPANRSPTSTATPSPTRSRCRARCCRSSRGR